jgi:hypothetical protein
MLEAKAGAGMTLGRVRARRIPEMEGSGPSHSLLISKLTNVRCQLAWSDGKTNSATQPQGIITVEVALQHQFDRRRVEG